MPGKNKTPLLGWHPRDPRVAPWIRAEAERRGVTVSTILNEMAEAYYARHKETAGARVVMHAPAPVAQELAEAAEALFTPRD